MHVALEDGLHNAAQVDRFLPDACDFILLRVEGLEELRHRIKADFLELRVEIGVDPHGHSAISDGRAAAAAFLFLIIDARRKVASLHGFHEISESVPEGRPVRIGHGGRAAVIG